MTPEFGLTFEITQEFASFEEMQRAMSMYDHEIVEIANAR